MKSQPKICIIQNLLEKYESLKNNLHCLYFVSVHSAIYIYNIYPVVVLCKQPAFYTDGHRSHINFKIQVFSPNNLRFLSELYSLIKNLSLQQKLKISNC